jgi:putative membrane protein insertion efficiency factor
MRRTLAIAGVLIGLLMVADGSRPPERQVTARVAMAGIAVYQSSLGRAYAALGVSCRFTPTCSHYGMEVLRHHGWMHGGWLAVRRLVRCGPWTPAGTIDPPPARAAGSGG